MKFSSYTQAVQPNTINNAQVRAVTDPHAYGTGGKEWDALTGAIGQANKVATQIQEQNDTSDTMEARNKIMSSLTENLYGENGLFTTGVGENAKGLTSRTTDLIRKTFADETKNYNGRVQRALQGSLNENMANFQRIAASQEQHEYKDLQATNYASALSLNANNAGITWAVPNSLTSINNDSRRIITDRAKLQGWSGGQVQAEIRKALTQNVSQAVTSAITNENYDRASEILHYNRKDMEQGEYNRLLSAVKAKQETKNNFDTADNIFNQCWDPKTGHFDWTKADKLIEQNSYTHTGGSYSGDDDTDKLIQAAAEKYNLDPALLAGLAQKESTFSQDAVSPVGAIGMMQLMPDTAAALGVDPHDKAQNIEGGAKYLREQLDTFDGDVAKALAAYNAGPQAVKEYGGVPPYAETQDYVQKVQEYYNNFKQNGGPKSVLDTERQQKLRSYVKSRVSDATSERKAMRADHLDDVSTAVDNAGSYSDALAMIDGDSSLNWKEKQSLKAQAASKFGIVSSRGGGSRSGGGGRSGGGYNPAKDQAIVDKYNYFRDNGYNISGSLQYSANQATARLQANGYMGTGDNLDSGEALNMAMHAVEVTANDEEARWYLESKYNYSEGEADYYVKQAHRERDDDMSGGSEDESDE